MNVPKHTFRNKPPAMSMLGGRILWGRVIFFGTTLALVFLLGLLVGMSSGDGIAPETHEKAVKAKTEAEQEVTQLQAELKLASEKINQLNAQTQAGSTGESSGESSGPDTEQTYETKKGDTLWGIAAKFYGDGNKWIVIAEANGLTKDSPITSGMKLKIPPKSSGTTDDSSNTTPGSSEDQTTSNSTSSGGSSSQRSNSN